MYVCYRLAWSGRKGNMMANGAMATSSMKKQARQPRWLATKAPNAKPRAYPRGRGGNTVSKGCASMQVVLACTHQQEWPGRRLPNTCRGSSVLGQGKGETSKKVQHSTTTTNPRTGGA